MKKPQSTALVTSVPRVHTLEPWLPVGPVTTDADMVDKRAMVLSTGLIARIEKVGTYWTTLRLKDGNIVKEPRSDTFVVQRNPYHDVRQFIAGDLMDSADRGSLVIWRRDKDNFVLAIAATDSPAPPFYINVRALGEQVAARVPRTHVRLAVPVQGVPLTTKEQTLVVDTETNVLYRFEAQVPEPRPTGVRVRSCGERGQLAVVPLERLRLYDPLKECWPPIKADRGAVLTPWCPPIDVSPLPEKGEANMAPITATPSEEEQEPTEARRAKQEELSKLDELVDAIDTLISAKIKKHVEENAYWAGSTYEAKKDLRRCVAAILGIDT